MPYEEWKAKYQGSASPEQLEAMKKAHQRALMFSTLLRHGRAMPGHPRLHICGIRQVVDARDRPGHDDVISGAHLLWARCG